MPRKPGPRTPRKPGLHGLFAATLFGIATAAAAPPPASVDLAAADNAFGFRLLNAVQRTVPDGNVVLSPLSAALNLSMALDGAAGQTRQELLDALSLTGAKVAAIDAANAQLVKVIRTPARGITLSLANSLWVDSRRATLRPEYVRQIRAGYGAEIAAVDFSGTNTASQINSWASRETRGAIPMAIDRLDPADVALLLNVVYFRGEWAQRFDKAQTRPHDFTLAGGATRQVPRMSRSGRFDYFETPGMQGIRLPFGDGDLVMEVLLPAQSAGLRTLERQLTTEHWTAWQARYAPRSGTLELPRFELKSGHRLTGPLQALGVKRAFDPDAAQLTGMFSPATGQAGTGHSFVSAVLQSTDWKVDEEGAEAAAATSTTVRPTVVARPEQPFRMIVDHPFFCAIRDQRSGALLFIAAIYDPAP